VEEITPFQEKNQESLRGLSVNELDTDAEWHHGFHITDVEHGFHITDVEHSFSKSSPEGKRLAARNRRRKILPCPQCDHVASHVDSLKCHIKSVHEGIRYQCDQCAHAATSVGNLNKHKKRMHMNKENTNDQPEKPLEQVKESSLSEQMVSMMDPNDFMDTEEEECFSVLEQGVEMEDSKVNMGQCEEEAPVLEAALDPKMNMSLCVEEAPVLVAALDPKMSMGHCEEAPLMEETLDPKGIMGQCVEAAPVSEVDQLDMEKFKRVQNSQAKRRKSSQQTKNTMDNYYCDECDYSSIYPSKLKRHIGLKHDIKGIPCTMYQCNYVAKHLDYLKNHIRARHEGIRYQCDLCTYASTCVGNLNKHKRRKHDRILPEK